MQTVITILKEALLQLDTDGRTHSTVIDACSSSMVYEVNLQTHNQLQKWYGELINPDVAGENIAEKIAQEIQNTQAKHAHVIAHEAQLADLVTVNKRKTIHSILAKIDTELKRMKERKKSLNSSFKSKT